MSQNSQNNPPPPTDEPDVAFSHSSSAFERLYQGRVHVPKGLFRSPLLHEQAAEITNGLWRLVQQPRPEDEPYDGIIVVEGVTLRLLPGETPPERIRRAMETIFGVTIGEMVRYKLSQVGAATARTKVLKVVVSEPFGCVLELIRRIERGDGLPVGEPNGVDQHTTETFELIDCKAAAVRAYVRACGERCQDQSLRNFLLNFTTKESLQAAITAMLAGGGSTVSRMVGQPVRQLRGIRIRRHESGTNATDEGAATEHH